MNSVTNSAIRSRKYQVKRNKLNKTKQIKKHLNVQNYYLKNAKKKIRVINCQVNATKLLQFVLLAQRDV